MLSACIRNEHIINESKHIVYSVSYKVIVYYCTVYHIMLYCIIAYCIIGSRRPLHAVVSRMYVVILSLVFCSSLVLVVNESSCISLAVLSSRKYVVILSLVLVVSLLVVVLGRNESEPRPTRRLQCLG